ncbi:MAG: hypothetical protein ABF477_03935 [Leuconostoc pseudomesenteroides]
MSKKNENNDVIEHSMSKSETRSMPVNGGENPDKHLNNFERKTNDSENK